MEDEFIPERPVPIVYTLSQQKQIIIEYIKKLIQQIEDYKNYVKLSRGNPAMDINRRIIEKKINNLKNNFGSIIKNFILSRNFVKFADNRSIKHLIDEFKIQSGMMERD